MLMSCGLSHWYALRTYRYDVENLNIEGFPIPLIGEVIIHGPRECLLYFILQNKTDTTIFVSCIQMKYGYRHSPSICFTVLK